MSDSQAGTDFESWVRAEGAALLRFAFLLLRDSDRAEEAVQDALVSAYPRWQRIVAGGDPGAYLRRSVVNADTTRWRRFRRRETPVAEPRPADERDTADHAESAAQEDAAWALCATLPTKQRAAIVLRYFEGRSDAEIAAALDCSPATVRSQIHRALATLRGRLTLQQEVEQA